MAFYFILASILVIDVYLFFGIRSWFDSNSVKALIIISIQIVSVLVYIGTLVYAFTQFTRGISSMTVGSNWLIGLTVTFLITKIVLLLFLVGEDIYRLISYFFNGQNSSIKGRRKFIGNIAIATAAIPFASFLYGVAKGRYNFKVQNVQLTYPDLPTAFDGFKIVQISDIHSGSFDSKDAVQLGINLVQDQNPDLIVFTGDLVNNLAEEIEPYIDMFKNLNAPYGKFSVMGNHDYGEYYEWDTESEKDVNIEAVKQQHPKMGFKLLNNEHQHITKNGESICLLGVENWGEPPFPSKGDLDKALDGIDEKEFCVLLSHDPDHFEYKVKNHPKKIHLTLSGHTHGMQMGIDIPWLKWSPVKYKYPRWAGLYEENQQKLYVNRGFGYIGYAGRVGIWPEITVLELKKG